MSGGGVVESGLGGVEDLGERGEGGVGDDGGDGCLSLVLVPHDGQVGRGEQAGLEDGQQGGNDVPWPGTLYSGGTWSSCAAAASRCSSTANGTRCRTGATTPARSSRGTRSNPWSPGCSRRSGTPHMWMVPRQRLAHPRCDCKNREHKKSRYCHSWLLRIRQPGQPRDVRVRGSASAGAWRSGGGGGPRMVTRRCSVPFDQESEETWKSADL